MGNFIFELGTEEVPVSEIINIKSQLKEKFIQKLNDNLIDFKEIELYATNRRFLVHITDLSDKAKDREERVSGPPKRVAYDENGEPTIALKKFLEFNNIELSDTIEFETKKGVYIGIEKKIKGKETKELLKKIVAEIINEIRFSKTMIWNLSGFDFIRPIRNLLILFNNDIIEINIAGVRSSNKTRGHLLMSDDVFEVNSFADYLEKMAKNFVIVNEAERRKIILEDIKDIEDEFEVKIGINEDMLNYYIYNNEYPVVFHGEFNEKYLDLPREIISAFMINEKKLIPVYDKDDNLLNMFVGVSNVPDEQRNVVNGNEKVIRAAFEDANFFWDNDKKDDFYSLRDDLKNVLFQRDLGTYFEKTERLEKLSEYFCEITKNPHIKDYIKKASTLCKNDLLTRMVREFPSLQGIMGGLYLKEIGEDKRVYDAVYYHYEPKGFTDDNLTSIEGGLLSIIDKIDNIVAFISKGVKISSSKDPYGIRRDANAIVKISIDFKLNYDLIDLIEFTANTFNSENAEDVINKTKLFFISRLENIFKDFLKFRYDIVNAVLIGDTLNIFKIFKRLNSLNEIVINENISDLISLHKRLKNIVKGVDSYNISENRFIEKEEKILFDIFKEIKPNVENEIIKMNYIKAISIIMEMKPVIDDFFDNVLVMVEDEEIKKNRIGLIQKVESLLSKIADFSLLVQ